MCDNCTYHTRVFFFILTLFILGRLYYSSLESASNESYYDWYIYIWIWYLLCMRASVTSRSRKFSVFLPVCRNHLVPKKVLEVVPEKMVPKISTGTSTWKIWHQKKAPVSEQISGTVTLCMTVHSPINISQLQWIFEPLKICGRLQSVQST